MCRHDIDMCRQVPKNVANDVRHVSVVPGAVGVSVALGKVLAVVVHDAVVGAHVITLDIFDLGSLDDTLDLVEGGRTNLTWKEHLCQTPHVSGRRVSYLQYSR